MLFKNLKELIKEADEPAEGEEGAEEEKPVDPRKPEKFKKNIKDASDGVGNELYELSTKIGEKVQSTLPMMMDVKGVKFGAGLITLTGLKEKSTGAKVSLEHVQALVNMIAKQVFSTYKGSTTYALEWAPLTVDSAGDFVITVVEE